MRLLYLCYKRLQERVILHLFWFRDLKNRPPSVVTFSTHYMRTRGNNRVIPSSLLLHNNLLSNYLWKIHKAERSDLSILLALGYYEKHNLKYVRTREKTETIQHQVVIHSQTLFKHFLAGSNSLFFFFFKSTKISLH